MSGRKILWIFFFANITLTCTFKEKYKDNKYGDIDFEGEIAPLLNEVIHEGDTSSYKDLYRYYSNSSRLEEIMYYSMYMANKYNFREAYFHVYWILRNGPAGDKFENFDPKTKNLALFYLLRSYEMGHKTSEYIVKELFKNREIPAATSFLDELSKENILSF